MLQKKVKLLEREMLIQVLHALTFNGLTRVF